MWRKGSDGWLPFVVGIMFLATVIMYMTIARATRIVVGWMQGGQKSEQTSAPPLPAPTQTTDSKWFDISPFTNLSMVWQVSIAITAVVFLALVVTWILYLIQSKKIKESNEGGDKKPSDGTKPPAPPKGWKERYKEIEDDFAKIRNWPYVYFIWVIAGWLGIMLALKMLYPELPTWNWIWNKHFILFWSTPLIILVGMWSFRNQSRVIKGFGILTWAPLGYLWITSIASDVDFSGWWNQFQSVSTSTASGATNHAYTDEFGNPKVEVPVPASGHWSQYEFRGGSTNFEFGSNVPIEVRPNRDNDLVRTHNPGEKGPFYPPDLSIWIIEFRSTTNKDGIAWITLYNTR